MSLKLYRIEEKDVDAVINNKKKRRMGRGLLELGSTRDLYLRDLIVVQQEKKLKRQ
jgi:hypothetical protein